MDDLAAALEGSFHVTTLKNDPSTVHPRFAIYKSNNIVYDQEKRRRLALDQQKQKRFDSLNNFRNLSDATAADEAGTENSEEAEFEGEKEEEREDEENNYNWKNKFPSGNYRNILMLSEWMLDIPENFEIDWLMVSCPVGKRCLVISAQGQTRAYSKQGYLLYNFHSALPGGSYQTKHNNNNAKLDCIYSEVSQCFYVLDIIHWNKHNMLETETAFRVFWLSNQFSEYASLQKVSRANPYIFTPLKYHACQRDNIQALMSNPFDYELDGLLFYHKNAHYTRGSTPLAVWLKAYMLPEVLSVPVAEKFLALAPVTYSGMKQHIDDVREREIELKIKKKNNNKKSSHNKIDN